MVSPVDQPATITFMLSVPRLPLRAVLLPKNTVPGKLYLSSVPGRYEPLSDFLNEIRVAGVKHILCLVWDEEIARKSLDYLTAIHNSEIPISRVQFAIPDFGLPDDPEGLRIVLNQIHERMDEGESVVIHCAGGHGRTGAIATLLLMELGLTLDHASELVMLAGSAPDTEAQRQFLTRWKTGNPEH